MTEPRTVCSVCAAEDFCLHVEKDGYRYVRCAGCGVVRQYPYPTTEETASYYERYQSHKSASSLYLSDAGFEGFKRDKLLTFSDLGIPEVAFEGKRLCDVGCATGQFLEMMADRRLARMFGIDVSEECVNLARARNLDCDQGDFLEVREIFDVITMWHLIEHLSRPQLFVNHAHRLLTPTGWLLLRDTRRRGDLQCLRSPMALLHSDRAHQPLLPERPLPSLQRRRLHHEELGEIR